MVDGATMSHTPSRPARTPSTTGTVRATVQPNPVQPGASYTIAVTGGIPPYTFVAQPAPPNPPGITLHPQSPTCDVDVPASTPPGTDIYVMVYDSSTPPQQVGTRCQVG